MGLKERFLLRIAKRWIAGVDLDSALNDAKKANSRGLGVVVNFLGEEIKDPAKADSHTAEYLRLQQAMADSSIQGFASVKLTQLGLSIDQSQAAGRLEKIASNSERLNQWLWIDMEASKFTDATLSVYKDARQKHVRLGLALQAYMRRSGPDLNSLLDQGASIRLVKGAYREGHESIYPSRKEIRDSYTREMKTLFERGDNFAIATHDTGLVEGAKRLAESKHASFRFEMLKGIRDEYKADLVSSGYKVSEYLPYGDQWYSYSKRRVTEHPSNVWLLLRSLF